MGAPVRESDDSEPLKDEPLKNEPLKNESLKPESLKPGSLKNESSKNQPSKDEPKNVGAAPSSGTTEAPEPPWKRKTRRSVFEGDVAVVELRSRLALAPERVPEPAVPISTVSTFAAVLRLMGGVLMAAAVAGDAGYLWGFRLSTKSPQLAPASDQANVLPARSTPAANLKASNPDSGRPSGPAAAIAPARVDARGAANDVTSLDAIQRPVPSAAAPRPILPSPASPRPAPAEDASEIAAKMKIGAELMANGDITAARMMFQRAAEAGEAAGAFALAETYDPVVLRRLRLWGGIAPDVALARSWYEKARDLGSIAAPERIVRLTQIPQ